MNRIVQPEILDELSPDDSRAIRSRRDLQRINLLMDNASILARALGKNLGSQPGARITEIGAGDGSFMLSVARKLAAKGLKAEVTLLDRQSNCSADLPSEFEHLGWRPRQVVADVFAWEPAVDEVVMANLFLHHFEPDRLAQLLGKIAASAKLFIALEPRRARWPLFCSRLLWAIGCNEVTRHDAVVSVRAGFCGDEISALWPDKYAWQLTEQSVGLFSHLFIARKIP